ncbi:hypothetical protein DSM43518_02665 [Mycobacterium marinum]|nr:hypothetical protein DE4381_03168 [Mycobacterium marinum]RFZ09493.1 hypothetical protein DSM43518_02665 [Mycobacterium marinum]RFZ15238.1 hypothetical protein VIMS_02372 [Mycobacterium marinum]RFZ30541.1 hypothetical protein NCTC2275_03984 [Mycobacterium marinum]RFZ54406.1 hypothetical protein MSS4_00122 [Mycobacterium marinum]
MLTRCGADQCDPKWTATAEVCDGDAFGGADLVNVLLDMSIRVASWVELDRPPFQHQVIQDDLHGLVEGFAPDELSREIGMAAEHFLCGCP